VILVKDRGGWGFPRGKGREGESPEASAIREVYEETGVDILLI
jgi:8-oxo-dGTP pyrophosphatase MutT (NUDIX family)